jgi:hypothetical protein
MKLPSWVWLLRQAFRVEYVATRELRNRPGAFQDLVDEDDAVLTSSGKPFGLVIGVDDENVEETVRLVRRVRAEQALSRLRKRAAEQGLDRTRTIFRSSRSRSPARPMHWSPAVPPTSSPFAALTRLESCRFGADGRDHSAGRPLA